MLLENPHVKGNLELFVILVQEGHLLTPETAQVKAFLQPATIFRKKPGIRLPENSTEKNTNKYYTPIIWKENRLQKWLHHLPTEHGTKQRLWVLRGRQQEWLGGQKIHAQIEMIGIVHFTKQTFKREHNNSIWSKEWSKQGRKKTFIETILFPGSTQD